jgi:pimeloyl-ACP methyl ester carboxylesterase
VTFEAGRLADDVVALPDGRPQLAVRRTAPGDPGRRPFVLVHGLASNARLWDGVATALAARGHACVAVDLRGHGLSEAPDDGYDTVTCADDLAALLAAEGLTDDRSPIVAGQSWGGNVVLTLAARHPRHVAGIACVDGGWIRLRDRFTDFDDCWAALAPPRFDGMTYAGLTRLIRDAHPNWPRSGIEGTLANLIELPDGGVRARLSRRHHESIVRSLFEGDPYDLYPRVSVPVLLVPATGEAPSAEDGEHQGRTRDAVHAALGLLPDARVRWYAGADHDIHAQFPERLAADLADLAELADGADVSDLADLTDHPDFTDPARPDRQENLR